ncbi:MAG: HAD-IA family hydrolase [Anaerolineaceae bacterium]|nr:HAD-IA family hydrolase [Anaerolineaceae bacterium]
MSFSALLFDMDGVVIDTHHSVTVFWEALARQYHIELTEDIFAQHIYGTPAVHTLSKCFSHLSTDEHKTVLESLARYESQLVYREVKGITRFLRALNQHQILTALVTSAEPRKVRNVVDQLGLEGLFSTIVTADDVKIGKPDPQCYLLAAQRLNKTPDQCVVFEDAVSGVKAGVAAGMLCIGIQSSAGGASLLAAVGAKYVVPDFSAIRLELAEITHGEPLNLLVDGEHNLLLKSD